MKKVLLFFLLLLQSTFLPQNNFIKQITSGDFDARNPFIYKDELGFLNKSIFFELHKNGYSNIYAKKYNSNINAFEDTVALTMGEFNNINPSYHPNIGLIYQTNKNGNWDIVFIPDSEGVWKDPILLTSTTNDEINPKYFKIIEDYFIEYRDSSNFLFKRNSDVIFLSYKFNQITEQVIFNSDSEYTCLDYVGAQIQPWAWNPGYYIFCIEENNQGVKRIVRKYRSYDGILSDKIILKDNCNCSGLYFNYSDYGNLGLFYLDTLQGEKRYFVLENPIDNNPPSFALPILHDGNLSALDIYFFQIVTKYNELIYGEPQLIMPHTYLVEENGITYVRFDPIDLGIWERDSLHQILIQNSKTMVGGLGIENNLLLVYTTWEDSIDGHIQLFGTPLHMSLGAVENESYANDFVLYQNYPNPFNPSTKIEYKLLKASDVKFIVFSILGEKVFEQNYGYQTAGSYKIDFDGKNLPSGVYIYSIYTDENRLSRKMMLMK